MKSVNASAYMNFTKLFQDIFGVGTPAAEPYVKFLQLYVWIRELKLEKVKEELIPWHNNCLKHMSPLM